MEEINIEGIRVDVLLQQRIDKCVGKMQRAIENVCYRVLKAYFYRHFCSFNGLLDAPIKNTFADAFQMRQERSLFKRRPRKTIEMKLKSNVRISALKWSHVVAKYATWVIMSYLTDVWGLSITKAAGIVNIWNGIENLMQLVFAFLADELMGKYLLLLLSSIAYSIYKPECIGYTQEVLFYTSLALIAVGISGQAVSLDSFFRENTSEDNGDKEKSCTRFFVAVFGMVAPVIAGIILPYISSWKIQFGIPALCTLLATLLFISGSRSYKTSRVLKGSPLTYVFRVFVASASKIFQRLPDDDNQLYGKDDESARNLPYPGLRFQNTSYSIFWFNSKSNVLRTHVKDN
ncbi:hypothetical protein LguiA_029352 [Lonicera macranthoides]